MSSGHAVLAPSSAERWVNCPGSITLQAQYKELEDSQESREGTASHWVASERLTLCKSKKTGMTPSDFVGLTAPNGVIITEEMVEVAGEYVDHVMSVIKTNSLDLAMLNIESRVMISKIHGSDCWGTPDAWVYDPEAGQLYVFDYKYGHRAVAALDNWQLILYSVGLLAFLFPDAGSENIRIHIHIVQPRSYHRDGPLRMWETSLLMLRAHINRLIGSAEEALGDNPRTVAGIWCRDCMARHVCPALQKASMLAVEIADGVSPEDMGPGAIGTELSILTWAEKIVKYRKAALEEQALALIKSGKLIPGYAVQDGTGRQKWSRTVSEIKQLGEVLGFSLCKERELITPKQAITLGLNSELVKSYSETPKTGIELVADDGSKARSIFQQTKKVI